MTGLEVDQPTRRNVILTSRDLAVLKSLYDNCVMTYSQIARLHFPNAAKPTVLNRLAKLERAKVLSRERIPRMELGLDKNAVGVVFQITRVGILELRQRISSGVQKPEPIRIHPYSLNHDLILVDLAAALERRFGKVVITNGKLLSGSSQSEVGLEPDLVVTWPDRPGRMAIELELSGKAEKRYREIVLRYRLSKEYERVVYFIDDPFIRGLLTRVILNRNAHAEETPRTGKFYFSKLSDFLKSPEQVPITSGAEDIQGEGRFP